MNSGKYKTSNFILCDLTFIIVFSYQMVLWQNKYILQSSLKEKLERSQL